MAASGVTFAYTGTYDSFGDASQGYLVLKTSGTLTIKGTVDLCLVGGGGKGYKGWITGSIKSGGAGGCGGYVENFISQELNGDYSVTIGAGSSTEGAAGGATQIGSSYTANGGNSGGATVYNGANGRGLSGYGAYTNDGATHKVGGNGEDGVFPWNDSTNFSGNRVSGCGGGGAASPTYTQGSGGAGGGGDGGGYNALGNSATENTGGGGGGSSYQKRTTGNGGNGGSGVVFVRWGY